MTSRQPDPRRSAPQQEPQEGSWRSWRPRQRDGGDRWPLDRNTQQEEWWEPPSNWRRWRPEERSNTRSAAERTPQQDELSWRALRNREDNMRERRDLERRQQEIITSAIQATRSAVQQSRRDRERRPELHRAEEAHTEKKPEGRKRDRSVSRRRRRNREGEATAASSSKHSEQLDPPQRSKKRPRTPRDSDAAVDDDRSIKREPVNPSPIKSKKARVEAPPPAPAPSAALSSSTAVQSVLANQDSQGLAQNSGHDPAPSVGLPAVQIPLSPRSSSPGQHQHVGDDRDFLASNAAPHHGHPLTAPNPTLESHEAQAKASIQYPPAPRLVSVNCEADWAQEIANNETPPTYLDLGPLFIFTDNHIDNLLSKGPALTRNVIQITAGNPELRLSLLSDAGLSRLVAACPRLEYLSIHGAVRLSDRSVRAVVQSCVFIRHVALCGADFEPNDVCGSALVELVAGRRRLAVFLNKVALRNTAVRPETVRRLRHARPLLKVSAGG